MNEHGKLGTAKKRPGEAMKPDMELALWARAENIAIVRHALGGLGEAFEISDEKLSDIRLAVTEACSNVVVHAYPEDSHAHRGPPDPGHADRGPATPAAKPSARARGWGTMEISATMLADELVIVVRDWGQGIRPRPDSPGLGLGLSLIAALAQTVQLGHDTQEHTEVRMTFALSDEFAEPGSAVPDIAATAVASRPQPLRGTGDGRP
jgi:serine/threonine-protein kinase RsbW